MLETLAPLGRVRRVEAGARPGRDDGHGHVERMKTEPIAVLRAAKEGEGTWGVVVQGLGLTPKQLDTVVRQTVRPRPA